MSTSILNKDQVSKDSSEGSTNSNTALAQVLPTVPKPLYGERAQRFSLFKDCIQSLLRKPPKTTSFMLAAALCIPAAIAILSSGFLSAEKNLLDSRQVTVFVSAQNSGAASQLANSLAENKHIIAAELRDVDLQNSQVMAIDVHPAATLTSAQLSFIVEELNSHTIVEYVSADLMWLERNVVAIEAARKLRVISIAIAAVLTVVLVYLLHATELPRQRSELNALHQMGASRKMLQKPLLMRSTFLTVTAALLGTLLAWSIIAGMPKMVDMSTYGQFLPRSFPGISAMLLVTLAAICSFLAVKLSKIKE